MPFIIPFIPLIAAGIGAATTVASIESQPSGQSSQQVANTAPATPAVNTAGLSSAQKQAATTTSSNVQANTSGFATPDYLQSILTQAFGPSAANQTGSSATGDIQSVVNQAFGLGAPGNSSYSPTQNSAVSTPTAGLSASPTATPTPTASASDNPLASILPRLLQGGAGGQPPGGGSNLVGSLLEQNFNGFSG